MREYETLGHLISVPPLDHSLVPHYYLPHHGILKEDGESLKFRVVFNGCAQANDGQSLNDILHIGEKLQADIFDVLLYFRRFKFVFLTDITKMFRQILIHPDDRRYQRILWTDDQGKTTTHELTTVTYGTRPAPYLAGRVMNQLIMDEGPRFPLSIEPMTSGRYVDDISGGADSPDELLRIAQQLTDLCHAGGFPLAKWKSNLPPSSLSLTTLSASHLDHTFDSKNVKVLGLNWSPSSDSFKFSLHLTTHYLLTNRAILSDIAQIFDPLGFIAPVVIKAKILLQSLWLEKLSWDDSLSPSLSQQWNQFQKELVDLSHEGIPCWIGLSTCNRNVQVHGFSDASQLALSAVIYFCNPSSQTLPTHFICSKTKVAPLKPCTIPRLELAAAALLVRLTTRVIQTLHLNEHEIFLWTDSNVALSWIQNHPSRWKDFVRNRVHFIQESLPQAKWRLVPGKQNPADCASRGLFSTQIINHSLWWRGPPWLPLDQTHWPSLSTKPCTSANQEERPGLSFISTLQRVTHIWDLSSRYSSLHTLLRITALCKRVVAKFKRSLKTSILEPISPNELDQVLQFWIQVTQQAHFWDTINSISQLQPLTKSNPLLRLTPFLDYTGTFRVGGRLHHCLLEADSKNPIILPRHCSLSSLLIADAYLKTLHGGTQATLTLLRQKYWIVGGRAPVRSYILKCITCARHRSVRAQQLMGQLPSPRVTPSRPFSHTGVDYAGPVILKTWSGRGAKTHKGWLAIFVCLSTSAIHLEVVSDYSKDKFIAAYRRLIGRRGSCQTLYSDCGTTFQGADSALKDLFSSASKEHLNLSRTLLKDGTSWSFIPPAAPHFGGKWEAAVKSVKFHLRRTIGDTPMTFEELSTLLIQVESIVNSRPISPVSDDPEDISALTPGHFLIGEPLITIPEPSLEHIPSSRLDRWQFLQQRLQYFWSRWSSECLQRYLSTSKWHHSSNTLKVGSLVLLTDERMPPSKWPLARIVALHPGSDGLTRVVTLRTANTTLKRPISKLAILPPLSSDVSMN